MQGLKGTGSYDYNVADVFVPEHRTFALFTREPHRGTSPAARMGLMPITAAGHASWALGVAKSMLDDVEELAATKYRMSDMASLASRPTFQKGLAHHVAAWRAARLLVLDAFTTAEAAVAAGSDLTPTLRADMRVAAVYATDTARAAPSGRTWWRAPRRSARAAGSSARSATSTPAPSTRSSARRSRWTPRRSGSVSSKTSRGCSGEGNRVVTVRGLSIAESPAFTAEESARYRAEGWWIDGSISDAVHRNAERTPGRAAYIDHPDGLLTWHEFDRAATSLAHQLAGAGIGPADRVAVWHGDTAAIHVLFVAIERCGAVVVGIGARAGTREVAAILRGAQPRILITDPARSESTGPAIEGAMACLVLDPGTLSLNSTAEPAEPRAGLSPDDVFLINSTSGTTGLPKCVVHTQNRWHYFHQKAVANGELSGDDVFLPVIATPFGFGIWTTHTTPIHLGATAVLLERFTAAAACEAIERHRVTVLCCVSTQLTMLMADPARRDYDLSSLRVVFTGGEALPYRPAAEFEELTGAKILQFYGSNETGLLSGTTVHDSTRTPAAHRRPDRAGDGGPTVRRRRGRHRVRRRPARVPGTGDQPRLPRRDRPRQAVHPRRVDADGRYLRDRRRRLPERHRPDLGFHRAGRQEHQRVAGRGRRHHPSGDRGGGGRRHARSGVRREGLRLHRTVGSRTVELPELVEHLLAQGVSKELLPERLIVLDELPALFGRKDRQRPSSARISGPRKETDEESD